MVVSTIFGCDTPQPNEAFVQLLVNNPPVGINIFSQYNAGTVPDARGHAYDVAVGVDMDLFPIHPFPYAST